MHTLRRSAVRSGESAFFWTGLRRLSGAIVEKCPGEYSQVWDGRWESQGECEGCRKEPAVRGGSFYVECLPRLWAPAGRRDERQFGWEGPKVTILGTFQKQITHAKAGYKTKRGSCQNYASLFSLEWTILFPAWVISYLEWASQVRIVPLRQTFARIPTIFFFDSRSWPKFRKMHQLFLL